MESEEQKRAVAMALGVGKQVMQDRYRDNRVVGYENEPSVLLVSARTAVLIMGESKRARESAREEKK